MTFLDEFLYVKATSLHKFSPAIGWRELVNDLNGDITLENTTQMYNLKSSTKNPLKYSLLALSNISRKIEFNNPIYCFALPGFILSTVGLYMELNSLRTFSSGGSPDFGPTVLMILLTIVGMGLVFIGILLHSISGLFRRLA